MMTCDFTSKAVRYALVATGLLLAPQAHATVVESISGSVITVTSVGFANSVKDFDSFHQDFANAPQLLHSSASASFTVPAGSASLAEDSSAAWNSPDQGTADFAFIGSLFSNGPFGADVFYAASLQPYWTYQFTPNVDAILNMDATLTYQGGRGAQFDTGYQNSYLIDGVYFGTFVEGDNHISVDLYAGHTYTFAMQSDIGYRSSEHIRPYDDISIGTSHIAFNIVSSVQEALPEPGTWMMLIAGLGLVGWICRQSGQDERQLARA